MDWVICDVCVGVVGVLLLCLYKVSRVVFFVFLGFSRSIVGGVVYVLEEERI